MSQLLNSFWLFVIHTHCVYAWSRPVFLIMKCKISLLASSWFHASVAAWKWMKPLNSIIWTGEWILLTIILPMFFDPYHIKGVQRSNNDPKKKRRCDFSNFSNQQLPGQLEQEATWSDFKSGVRKLHRKAWISSNIITPPGVTDQSPSMVQEFPKKYCSSTSLK